MALRSLPKTLDETYARILCNIPDEYSDYAVRILRWLAYVKAPMRLEELSELIAVNPLGDILFDADIKFLDAGYLLDIFPGLLQVEVNKLKNPIVKLAHFSVKEYLISERIRSQKTQNFWLPNLSRTRLSLLPVLLTFCISMVRVNCLETLTRSISDRFRSTLSQTMLAGIGPRTRRLPIHVQAS